MAKLFTQNKEQSQLILFFFHNFFISIGTVLVYVSANIILLENHPEFSLPIAYIFSTFAMMGVGKIYEYYEHHFLLQKLSSRVLLAVLILSLIMVATLSLTLSCFSDNSIGPIVSTMAIIILFTIISTLDVPILQNLQPYLFTNHMVAWRNFFEDPIPVTKNLKSSGILLIHIVGLLSIAVYKFNKKDILS